MPGRNVFTVLQETAQQQRDAKALHQPFGGGRDGAGQYRSYSWQEWLSASREIALGLRSLGLNKSDVVCVLSETRAEFYLVDLGIMGAGGVAAALYTAYPMPELAKNVAQLRPSFLFVEDVKSLGSLAQALAKLDCPLPERVILLTGSAEAGTLTLDDLRSHGRKFEAARNDVFAQIQAEINPTDPAILYLTSGATGEPKMGLTSHAAILANLEMGPVALPITPNDSMLVFLPSAHIAQRIALELVPMRMGTPIWFSESLQRLPAELRSVKPTIFLAPPRVWEKMYTTVRSELRKRPPLLQKAFTMALKLSMNASQRRDAGKPIPFWMRGPLGLADRIMFSQVRERLGGRIRVAVSGAAPLGKDLADFYDAIRLPLIEGYGLTEAGILSFNPLGRPKAGSIGPALPGVEFRLADDGELLVRSPCMFQGYYKDEAATRSVLDSDGWFRTGDLAAVDDQGYWFITGRKKELIVSSNGKKIYPSRIENLFKMEPIVNQIVLIGDKRPYVTAIVTVNASEAAAKPLASGSQLDSSADESNGVKQAVQDAVSRVNRQLADFERIRRFVILERDFSIEAGELTPTMKIRRGRVLEQHAGLVHELYLGKSEKH